MPQTLETAGRVALALLTPDQPGNLGAVLRLGACLGAPVHVIEPCGFAFSERAWARSAMDYASLAEIHRHTNWRSFEENRPPGRLLALSAQASSSLWQARFQDGDTLLLGQESAGLPASAIEAADLALRIPLRPGARSLNIAIAAGIALAEAQRQLLWG